MSTLSLILLTVTLILCGAYAGMVLMCQIGVLPAMRQLTPDAYADAWRAMDTYMARLMPPYKGSLLLVNALTVAVFLLQRRLPLALVAALSLAFSVAGLVLTVRQQLPLNARLNSLTGDAPAPVLLDIRERTVQGFRIRFYLAAASYIILCIGIALWPVR